MSKLSDVIVSQFSTLLDEMLKQPGQVDEKDLEKLNSLHSKFSQALGISEHTKWRVQWQLEKWFDTARKLAGFEPDEIVYDGGNTILDVGATELLSIITGTGGTPYNAANAYIYVGSNNTAENTSQVGVIATGANRAFAGMDSGYPQVNNRQAIFRASFGDTSANFDWNEASIVNGLGVNAVAMNRKVGTLGTKATGTWTLQITVSLVS